MKKFHKYSLLLIILLLPSIFLAQNTEKKVILQGYWWDYKNDNFPNAWANYITELAPRLRAMGIDGVWIPPSIKNLSFGAEPGVGYAPFDNYDLGDKFQKGFTNTRLGTKDELLRMIAVLHANGIEVIQDIVPNHIIGAGSNTGAGGTDPNSTNDDYTNFRYTSYKTPATDESTADYLSRSGRFPKNYANFHPNPAHNCNSGDICSQFFGPDICFDDEAHGQSSNAIYNPIQTGGENNGYMRRQTRDWLIWYKKQLGFDGIRIDAVKHFDYEASEDFLYNLQFNANSASGGNAMFAVGEFVGNTPEVDNWYHAVQKRAGVFDFSLRAYDGSGGLYSMVYAQGGFDIAQLPAAQQTGTNRVEFYSGINTFVHRTVPFVNNHDTFRPILNAEGNYIGWNGGSELSPHIEPNEPRLATAYAVIFAMDGNPQLFFEDLFDVGYNANRFNHDPTNTAQLPVRSDLVNLSQCHQKLDFKNGAYKVRSSEPQLFTVSGSTADHLIIERSGKAVIGINDNWDTWQNTWITTDFPAGTKLMDYSGANGTDVKEVQADQRVNINTPPVNPALNIAGRHGYSVWAPVPNNTPFTSIEAMAAYLASYVSKRSPQTVQEWELSDDLGDSHCQSLGQGGRLPNNSCNYRSVGKIFAAANEPVLGELFPNDASRDLTFSFFDLQGKRVATSSGSGLLKLNYIPISDGWLTLKIRNTSDTYPGQDVVVRASYIAPKVVDTDQYSPANKVAIWTGNGGDSLWSNCKNWEEGNIPDSDSEVIIADCTAFFPVLPQGFDDRRLKDIDGELYRH